MQLRERNRGSTPMIGLTPLIDVVFILLIFFMLASSFLDWKGFEMSVSITDGKSTRQSDVRPVTVNVDANGGLSINGEAVALSGLVTALQRDHNGSPVRLRPVNGAYLQHLVDVMDTLGRGGVTDVEFIE
ncbi:MULTISPECIES: ExbD/TolR family protein [Thalassospira]|uniref:Biopolymer transporter ExbD n=2 Tax=Thalassospira TaxID=168934 RepID=A0A367VYD5_9PROT|nr:MULTISPECIES: biopolymer transporter ExbD [Thalassospira]MDG4721556.1 biopolymer transporter ExbD [Thalassospira sp. FZY0004]RCK31017.1 biopolymer transporter ExbD [Thalassospira profundimaris]